MIKYYIDLIEYHAQDNTYQISLIDPLKLQKQMN